MAAGVVFPDADADADAADSRTAAPFGTGLGLSGDYDPEPGMAGARAHNRRLADFVSAHPERHCGVALLPVTAPVDRVVAEVHRAKESGLGALMIPAMWVDKEPYHDRRYDPVGAAAAECGMPVFTHSGAVPRHQYGDHLGPCGSCLVHGPPLPRRGQGGTDGRGDRRAAAGAADGRHEPGVRAGPRSGSGDVGTALAGAGVRSSVS